MVQSITLQNVADTAVVNNDILGQICFAAPNEASGTDSILIAASIFARSEGTFAADNNATELVFLTGTTESASPGATNYDMTLSSAGNLIVAGTLECATSLTIGSAALSEAELEILDGATVTTTEFNLLDGGTSVGGSITVADADGFIVNDNGTMKTIPASDIKTYAGGGATDLDGLTDVISNITNFTDSIIISADGAAPPTGTLNAALGNVGLGKDNLAAITEGDYNVAIGFDTGNSITTGGQNVLIGQDAGASLTTGNGNICIGVNSHNNSTKGYHNIAIGYQAMRSSAGTSPDWNIGIGEKALYNIGNGDKNIAIGKSAGEAETGSWMLYIAYDKEASDGTLIKGDMYYKYLAIGMADDNYSSSSGSATLQIYPKTSTDKAIYVKQIASQSGDLLLMEDSSGTDLFLISSAGVVTTGTWQGTAVDGAYVDVEGTEIKSAGEGGGTKFLREDGDGTCSWQTAGGGSGDITGVTLAGDSGTAEDLTANVNLTVAGGNGITTSGSSATMTVALDAALTTVTSLLATDIKIGEDNETKVDFETANQINFYADNTKRVTIDSTGLTVDSGSLETATIDYTDGDLAMTIADGGAVTFAKSINQAANAVTDGGGVDIDCGLSNYHEVLMNATATSVVFTNATAGQRIVVRFKQHSSHIDLDSNDGWDTVTVNGSSATVTWPGGTIPTLTETNNAIDVYGFIFQSTVTNVHAFIIGQALA